MMSDDSENDGVYVENSFENDIYYKKYKLLLDRCEVIQKQNERLVYRLQQVKKITKNRQVSVQLLKEKLKLFGEDWTYIPPEVFWREEEPKIKDGKMEDNKPLPPPHPEDKPEKPVKGLKKPTKRKTPRSEKDPNAPKRPSNPFFQFCQEQRQVLMEQITSELKPGEAEPTKQELTKQLAIKWKSLSGQDKKVYVDMYERSKEKYAVELSEYNMKK